MMRDEAKTKVDLLKELRTLRKRASELEQVEKALQESEGKWRSLVENALDIIVIVDREGKISYVNHTISGIAPEKAVGTSVYDYVSAEYHNELRESLRQCFQAGETDSFELVARDRHDTTSWYDVRLGPVKHGGRIVAAAIIAKDIAERIKAEKELSRSEKQFKEIFENTAVGMYRTTPDGKILVANRALVRMLGFSSLKELSQRNLEEQGYEPRYARSAFKERIEREGQIVGLESQWIMQDGTKLVVIENARVVRDESGKILYYEGTAEDITERKKAEDTLRESEAKYRTLVDQLPAITYVAALDETSTTLYISPQVKDYMGFTPEEYKADPDIWCKQLHPDDRDRVLKKVIQSHTTQKPYMEEYRMITKNGSIVWFRDEAVIVKDEKNQPLFLHGVMYNITERKQAEESLKREKERAEQYLDTAEVGMTIVNSDENIFMINKKGCEILGYKEEELIGKNWFDILVPQRIRSEIRGVFRKLMAGDIKPVEYYENPLLTKDGDERLIAFHNAMIRDHDGKITGTLCSAEDITERKRAEEVLQESEERLRVALSAAQMGTWRWDPLTNQDTRDASLNLILGLEAVESTQPVEDFLHFVHPEDRDMANEKIQRAICEHRTYLAEFRIIRPDGTVRWLRDQGKPLCDENDRVLCLTGAVIDITERKMMEDELKKFKTIAERAGYGVAMSDFEGNLTYLNEPFAKMHGYKVGELIGKNLSIFHNKEQTKSMNRLNKQLMQKGSFVAEEIWHQRRDNTIFPALINAALIRDEERKPLFLAYTAVDITERVWAEDALRESELKYRTLLENLPQKIFLKDRDSVYISCNENYAGDLGIKSVEIAGKTDYDFYPEELAEKYMADDKEIIESGKTKDIEESYIQDGQEMIVHTIKTPVKDAQGNVVGVLGVFWDITELKKAEEKLERYREQMARAEHLASLGTLSATVAHELTQPLTVIQLSLENALGKLGTISSPEIITQKLKNSIDELSNITSIVDRFRNFARKSREKIDKEVELVAIAEKIVNLLKEHARRAKVVFRLKGLGKLPHFYSNEKDLEQLFFALIDNAIQSADGKKPRQVVISGAIKDKQIELRFSDNCGGIAPENLDKIFEPFFTNRAEGQGTGLGLCIVQDVVSRARGEVRAESKFGEGATFIVTLPINERRIS